MSYLNPRDHSSGVLRAEMARQRKGAQDLADKLKISRSSAQRRLEGETPITLDEVQIICEWLGISPSAFFPLPEGGAA